MKNINDFNSLFMKNNRSNLAKFYTRVNVGLMCKFSDYENLNENIDFKLAMCLAFSYLKTKPVSYWKEIFKNIYRIEEECAECVNRFNVEDFRKTGKITFKS
jgi:hypothetical protein